VGALHNEHREEVPEAAPEQHGCDKVDCSEESGYEDAQKWVDSGEEIFEGRADDICKDVEEDTNQAGGQ